MAIVLDFINYQKPDDRRDDDMRRRVRRHAMREVGLSRRKPKKPNRSLVLSVRSAKDMIESPSEILLPPLIRGVTGSLVDGFLATPIEPTRGDKSLIAYIFQDASQRQHRDDWFTVALTDKWTFYQVLANSAAHLNLARGLGPLAIATEDGRSAVDYHQVAVRMVRQQLQRIEGYNLILEKHTNTALRTSNLALIDQTIGCVTGFICYAAILGLETEWQMQCDGLAQLLSIRPGGLRGIGTHNTRLRATISWVELLGALASDIPPRYPLPDAWIDRAMSEREIAASSYRTGPGLLKLRCAHVSRRFAHRFATHDFAHPLASVLQDLSLFSQVAETELVRENTVEIPELPYWPSILMHRLLNLPVEVSALAPVSEYALSLAELCRLTMLLYVARLRRAYSVPQVVTATMRAKQSKRLEDIQRLEKPLDDQEWLTDLLLWITAVTAVDHNTIGPAAPGTSLSSRANDTRSIIFSGFLYATDDAHFTSATKMRLERIIQEMPWVPSVMNRELDGFLGNMNIDSHASIVAFYDIKSCSLAQAQSA